MPHAINAQNDPDGDVLRSRIRVTVQAIADRTGEAVYVIWHPEKRPNWGTLDSYLAAVSPVWVSESSATSWERDNGERLAPQSIARAKILSEVSAERQRQENLWGGQAHDDAHDLSAWLVILARHVGLAAWDGSPDDACHKTEATGRYDPVRYRKELVRVAAVAVAALEAFDRRQEREEAAPS